MGIDEIAKEAAELIAGDRGDYGDFRPNLELCGNLWSSYLGAKRNVHLDISGEDVAMLMVLLKAARVASGGYKKDNFVDIAGYASIAGAFKSD